MDLIYMNKNREDLGVLLDYELDMAYGQDENNFECTVGASAHCCDDGFYLYIEGTEYGGMIDCVASDSESKEVTYSGRTWHGILNSKVIEPDSGEAYLVLSGEANEVIGLLLTRMALSDLFEASAAASGLTVNSYKMNRYITGYDGIVKMLDDIGAKLQLTFNGSKVILSAMPVDDYTQDAEFDSDQVGFNIKKKTRTVNHLVCLGTGELENRMVVHLYADTSGNISQTQTQFGIDEYAEKFDYPNAESEEELVKSGKSELKKLLEPGEMSVDFDADDDTYDVGDIVGAFDNITQLSVVAVIRKKILTIKNGQVTISYKVGD